MTDSQESRDWTFNLKLYHLKVAGYISQHLPRDAHILDCGCGWGQVGKILEYFGYLGFEGFDKNQLKVSTCEMLGLSVYKGSLDAILYPSKYFDCVICMEVLEHLDDHVYETGLKEIGRVIKDDGLIIIEFPIGPLALNGKQHIRAVDENDVLRRLPAFPIVEKDTVYGRYTSQQSTSCFLALQG